jgi:cell division transport system permease protein
MASLSGLLQNWVGSLLTWLVIGIALALPTLLYLLLVNLGQAGADWGGKPRLSLYLEQGVGGSAGQRAYEQIASLPEVAVVNYLSSEDALDEFKTHSGFGDILTALEDNPLPAVIEVTPVDLPQVEFGLLIRRLEGIAGVESASVDFQWIERLHAIVAFGERLILALAAFLAFGVLLSIGNTIRLAIESRRSEIEVVKLVGGTDRFVRRPFLYLGYWYGAGGALCALVMVEISFFWLAGPIDLLTRSYRDDFVLHGLGFIDAVLLLGVGSLLGILGAAIAVRRHLRLIEPT